MRRPHTSAKLPLRDGLTARENEILALIVEGKSNTEIGAQLHLTEGTVKNYVSTILTKCEAKNRTELAIKVMTY